MSELFDRVYGAIITEAARWRLTSGPMFYMIECPLPANTQLHSKLTAELIPLGYDEPLAEKLFHAALAQKVARAAIEAMREPTDEMREAGSSTWPSGSRYKGGEELEVFQAMIDAALK